jgi:hypothetical protein
MVSAIDYMERALGYEPRAAQERLRVARALGDLPGLEDALQHNELHFSAVRELTRVATSGTERHWLAEARGKNARQIQQLVAGRRRGDLPSDPADPDLKTHVVRYELAAATFARLRQAQQMLETEHGRHLEDDELVAALCDAVLDGTPAECDGRPRAQIALTLCERCEQGWQHGAGVMIAVDRGTVERARCDAQELGSLDAAQPPNATREVPPKVVRFVWHRDQGRCQTPGCRSARGLEIHHLVRRVDGGGHDASNLTLRCGACHHAIHDGKLVVTGVAPDRITVHRTSDARSSHAMTRHGTRSPDARSPRSVTASSKLEIATTRAQARDALVKLGWTSAVARAAVEAASACVGADASVEVLLREAVRRCPLPA